MSVYYLKKYGVELHFMEIIKKIFPQKKLNFSVNVGGVIS